MSTFLRSIGVVIIALARLDHADAEIRYLATELWVPDATRVYPLDINNDGVIVGGVDRQNILGGAGFVHTGAEPLSLSDIKVSGLIYSINNAGQYVGVTSEDGHHAFRHTGIGPITSVDYIDVLLPANVVFSQLSVSDSGMIVGRATQIGGFRTLPNQQVAFADALTSQFSDVWPMAANSSGSVVGSVSWPTGNFRGYLSNGLGPITNNNTIGVIADGNAANSVAVAVNENNVFVGRATAGQREHAFRHQGSGSLTIADDLGTLDGLAIGRSEATDINEAGVIVGVSTNFNLPITTSRAFVFSNNVMEDLNNLIDPSLGWSLIGANAINDRGQIVGEALINGQNRGFLLTPVPEPPTMWMMAVSIVAMALCVKDARRRRMNLLLTRVLRR